MLSQLNYSILLIIFICSVSKIQSAIIMSNNYEKSKYLNNLKKEQGSDFVLITNEINKIPNNSNIITEKSCKIIS